MIHCRFQMERHPEMVLRTQSRLDGKWLKVDLQTCFSSDALAMLWNEMVKDGELSSTTSDSLINNVGATSRKGASTHKLSFINTRKPYYITLIKYSAPSQNNIYKVTINNSH